jgi:beta-N-acetylhexosaminidase
MTLREAIGQLFILGFEGKEVPQPLKAFLRQYNPGALILFARNLGSPEEVATMTEALQAASPTPLLIAIDQEGGRVARLGPPFTQWPSASAVGTFGSAEMARTLGEAMAKELLAVGINTNLAPVLDVLTNPDNPVMAGRSFGADPHAVARLGTAFFCGHRDAGVLAVGKHFPGHGDTVADSHQELPVVRHDLARLRDVEFVPFAEAIRKGIPALMTAHLLVPALDPERPATLSRAILSDLLRERLGFSGLIMSDDLLMRGIADTIPPGEAAIRFLEAGGDLILICQDEAAQREAFAAVAEAVETGRLSEARIRASCYRIARVKAEYVRRGTPPSSEAIPQVVGSDAHRRLAEQVRSTAI